MIWLLNGLSARKASDFPAIVNRLESITFAELWKKSEQIAQDIEATGKNTPVVIYGDKNINIVPTMIAALKTGRAYVPVDITFPTDRLEIIANTVDACAIYNYSGMKLDMPFAIREEAYVRETVCAAEVREEIPESRWVKEDDVCYILFTSGSTGSPKGVPISKANILNYIAYTHDIMSLESLGNRMMIPVSFSFDLSVQYLHVLLPEGKTLYCMDKPLLKDTELLVQWLIENDISYFFCTPSFLDICNRSPAFCEKNLPHLRNIWLCGEVLTKLTVRETWEKFPNITLVNTYGPTEATVHISDCTVTREMLDDNRALPIGRMLSEADWYIESSEGKRCADGETGELTVVSRSVSKGYFHAPERSANVFFRAEDGRMGYRTGDLVYSDKGMLYFVGRKDFQIKLHGYRIEIEDISRNLDRVSIVNRNAVLPVYDADGKVAYIAAFVTLRENCQGSKLQNIIQIKKELQELIPVYMIPQKVIILPEFPLNTNGKIDRKALAKMLEK